MQIVFLFYEGMTALDAIGPHEILSRLPNAIVKRAAIVKGPIYTCSELILNADYAISEISEADVLLIPGAGNATSMHNNSELLDWVRLIHTTTTWTTSVCTGSLILAAAGILSGKKATSHWAVLDRLKNWGVIPVSNRIVTSEKIVTCAGVSAGIDMGLRLASMLCDETIAKTIQLGLEYDPEPPFDSGSLQKADPDIVNSLRKKLMLKFEDI